MVFYMGGRVNSLGKHIRSLNNRNDPFESCMLFPTMCSWVEEQNHQRVEFNQDGVFAILK